MDRTKEYSFILYTMPQPHARSRLLELGVLYSIVLIMSEKVINRVNFVLKKLFLTRQVSFNFNISSNAPDRCSFQAKNVHKN